MRLRTRNAKRILVLLMSLALFGLGKSLPRQAEEFPLRVGVCPWPGSEALLLAKDEGLLPGARFTFLEATWPSVTYRAFVNGAVDVAILSESDPDRGVRSLLQLASESFMRGAVSE